MGAVEVTEEEKKAKRREATRRYYLKNKERIANDEERKAKMKARRQAREAADPDHHAKHYAQRNAREAANPEKYAEARAPRPARMSPIVLTASTRPVSIGQSHDAEASAVREGYPHQGIEHAGVEPRDPTADEAGFDLLRPSQRGQIKYGTTLNRGDLEVVGWLQHACEEALDFARDPKRCMRGL